MKVSYELMVVLLMLIVKSTPIVTSDSTVSTSNVTISVEVALELDCDSVLTFTNGVVDAFRDEAIISVDGSKRRNVVLYDLPCKLMSFAHSMLHISKRINYVHSNWACMGVHPKSKMRHKVFIFSLMAHFLLTIIRTRRWISLVLFVDEEDDNYSSTLMTGLADNGIQIYMLKIKDSNGLVESENIIPLSVFQHHNFVILSKHFESILAEAQMLSLFADPYRWMVVTHSPNEVLGCLKNLSLQYVNEVTIAVPDRIVTKASFKENMDYDEPITLACKSSIKSHSRDTDHHLQKITSNYYHLYHYSMLCQGQKLFLQSGGFWNANLFPKKDPVQMKWPPHYVNRNFTGCVFRVAVAHNPPYTIVQKQSKRNFTVTGFDYDVFKELSRQMNFGFKLYLVDDGEYGRVQANATSQRWTGLIGELTLGRAHMALPSLTMTEERSKVVDFSTQMSTSKTRIFIRQMRHGVGVGRYYAPFHFSLWFVIAVHLVVFTVAYAVAHTWSSQRCLQTPIQLNRPPLRTVLKEKIFGGRWNRWRRCIVKLSDIFYTFLCSGLLQGTEHPPTGLSERLVFATFVILVVLLHSIYSSVLVSYMSVIRPESPFNSIEDLANHRDFIPCILRGSSHEEIIKARHRKVYQQIAARGGQGLKGTYEDAIESMFKKKCAFISNEVNVEHLLQGNCSFQIAGREVYRFTQHLAFQQGFPHQAVFSIYLMKIQSAGVQSRLFSKHFHPMFGHCSGQSDHRSLTLGHVKSMFFVVCGGCIASTIFLILEKIAYYFRVKLIAIRVQKKTNFVYTVD